MQKKPNVRQLTGEVFEPRVSILIPVYNGSNFLDEAIQSALSQNYKNIEIIVVNDGSSDGGATSAIAKHYGDQIRYFEKDNSGVGGALNFAVSQMDGDYFTWLSHDDLFLPDKVEKQIQELSKQTNLGRSIIYGDFQVFYDDPKNTSAVTVGDRPPSEFRLFITRENCLHGGTLLVPRVAFLEHGGFNGALRTTQDYDLWFRMAATCSFIYQPYAGVKARHHPKQGSVTMAEIALYECDTLLEGFVLSLTEAELLSIGFAEIGEAYEELSRNFARRGFMRASSTAASLAARRLEYAGLLLRYQSLDAAYVGLLNSRSVRLYLCMRRRLILLHKTVQRMLICRTM